MPLIDIKNISKIYGTDDAQTVALRDVTLSIDKGEFVAIMGPSGSGKSTLLHILGLLDRPTKGEYFFNGKDVNSYTDDELAFLRNEKLGFVFQSFNLLKRTTVFDNVKLPLYYSNIPQKEWDSLVSKAINDVNLEHRTNHESAQLSGGEKQRVAIARAIVNDPDIVFADEPTGNLDSKSGGVIMDIIQDLNQKKGRTVILITHEQYTSQYARRIIKLKDGLLVSDKQNGHSGNRRGEDFIK